MIDLSLTDAQREVQRTARAFAEREILPRIGDLDSSATYDRTIYEKMGAEGFLGLPIPERYGGAGMDYIAFALLCEEMERADTAFRVILSVHTGLNSLTLLQWGSEEQKQQYLAPQARGEKLATFGLTEPGVGSDAGNLATTARRDGDRYILNGSKVWISLADTADNFLVFATLDKSAGHRGITAFIVERSFPGFSSESLHGKLGVRAGNTGIVTFDDCEVPAANRVGEEGEGFTIAMSAIDQGRYTVAAGSVGLAQACLDASVKYAHERKTFGSEIGQHQLVKQMISKMYAGIEAGRLLVFKAGWKKNARPAEHARNLAGEVVRHRSRGRLGPRRDPGSRGLRLQQRVPGGALPSQQQGLGDLRGNEPDPHAHAGRLRPRLPEGPPAPDAAAPLRGRDVARRRSRCGSRGLPVELGVGGQATARARTPPPVRRRGGRRIPASSRRA